MKLLRNCSFPALLGTFILAGCADTAVSPIIKERQEAVEARLETARGPAAQAKNDSLVVTDSVWLGDTSVQLQRGKPLPQEWEADNAIAIRSDNPLSLSQIAAIISSQTRIPVRLTGGANQLGQPAAAAAAQNAGGPGAAPAAQSDENPVGMLLSYEGKLSGLLDLCVGFFNVNWNYNGVSIEVSRYETRTFSMEALPGTSEMGGGSDSGGGGGDSGGSGGDSGSTDGVATGTIDTWNDISSTLTALLGGDGNFTISQSSGTIIVSTSADRMAQISSYLAAENARLSRQVAVNIEIYSVSIEDSQSYGLDAAKIVTTLGGDVLDIGFTGPPSALTDTTANISFTLKNPNYLSGTGGVLQALSTIGKTTRMAQIPITTLNNRPASQRIAIDTNYVSEIETTTTSGSDNVSTSVTTDTATSGINVTVIPRIMADGRVLLQYSLTQDQLLALDTFPAGDNTIQLPRTQSLSFSQQVLMAGGSTLVLAGFDQSDDNSDATGLGRPLTWILGGSKSSAHNRQMVVIAITPREINVSRGGAT